MTGLGLVTPIGDSTWETALALRARRSCYQEHETVLVADSPYGEVLRGACVSRVPHGLVPRQKTGARRLAALLVPPLVECLAVFPSSAVRQAVCEIVTSAPGWGDVVRGLLAEIPPGVELPLTSILPTGSVRTEFFSRIAFAAEELLAQRLETVVIGCADSLCDPPQLEALLRHGRLKDATNPYGIMAGEAAGAVLLERESAARCRGARILARVVAWGRATEPNPWPTGAPSTAEGLTRAFHDAFNQLECEGRSVRHVISDENGERARAREWALTCGRVLPNPEHECGLRHPALFVGDAGGAMGAVMFADAVARLVWRRPPAGRIALAVSDDEGDRRVLVLEAADPLPRREVFTLIREHLVINKRVGR